MTFALAYDPPIALARLSACEGYRYELSRDALGAREINGGRSRTETTSWRPAPTLRSGTASWPLASPPGGMAAISLAAIPSSTSPTRAESARSIDGITFKRRWGYGTPTLGANVVSLAEAHAILKKAAAPLKGSDLHRAIAIRGEDLSRRPPAPTPPPGAALRRVLPLGLCSPPVEKKT